MTTNQDRRRCGHEHDSCAPWRSSSSGLRPWRSSDSPGPRRGAARGPTRARIELVADQTRMFHAADDLRWTALQFERCATDLECELATAPRSGGVVSIYGYDPARVETLHHRTREALAALAGSAPTIPRPPTRCAPSLASRDDPRHGWMPFIDAIRTSTRDDGLAPRLDPAQPTQSTRCRRTGRRRDLAPTSWIATNGLDELTDTDVIDRLHDSIDAFRAAVAGGGDVDRAERQLATYRRGSVRRARTTAQRSRP